MNCPLCGAANTTGLRYCTRCGGNLLQSAPAADVERLRQTEHGWDIEKIESPGISGKRLTGIFWAVATFCMLSLFVLFGISVPLTIFHAPRDVVVPLYIFGPTAIVLIARMMIKQLSRLVTMMEEDRRAARPKTRKEVAEPPQITAPPQTFRSVTENTTRNFEPVYRDASEP